MDSEKKIAGQNVNLILKEFENLFELEGEEAALTIKNHLAISFFKMIMNDESMDDSVRNMSRSYLRLYEFFTKFDESAQMKK